MAGVATNYKRAFLRDLFDTAQEEGGTLLAALKAASRARLQAGSSGKVLVGHSANGHDHTWQIPSSFTPDEAVNLVEELRTRYDEARAKLVATDEIESPTDSQIFNEMMDKLRPVRSFVHDHSNGRLEPEEVTD